MKNFTRPLERLRGLTGAVTRFPLTAAFLLAAAGFLAYSIETTGVDVSRPLLTCAVGAMLGGGLQTAGERFSRRPEFRLLLYGGGLLLTLGYFFLIRQAPAHGTELSVRTAVALLALFFAFLWLPVLRSPVTFNESFMAAFKAFFHAALYAAVLFGGCSLITAAVDTLIADVSARAYSHIANLVFVLFLPAFFLSLIPVYPGRREEDMGWEEKSARRDRVDRAASCPKILEVLISYLIIPLTAAFTLILALYIALNIGGAFWSNNLLEPMLVSYAVTVIAVYLLASRLEHKSAALFRLIFPKVLVPVMLFQIASSILSLRGTGVTHGRYFAVLFGLFAACAGVVMSVVPVRKNGILAALLIAFCAVASVPPVDAFTVSRLSQTRALEDVLARNGMLQNDTVTPNGELSEEDKRKIITSVDYLDSLGYLDRVGWLPEDFSAYEDFYATFGFARSELPQNADRYVNVTLEAGAPLDIAGYDLFTRVWLSDGEAPGTVCSFERMGSAYTLKKEAGPNGTELVLTDGENREAVRLRAADLFDVIAQYPSEKTVLTAQEAVFSAENQGVTLTAVVQNASVTITPGASDPSYFYAELYLFIRFESGA